MNNVTMIVDFLHQFKSLCVDNSNKFPPSHGKMFGVMSKGHSNDGLVLRGICTSLIVLQHFLILEIVQSNSFCSESDSNESPIRTRSTTVNIIITVCFNFYWRLSIWSWILWWRATHSIKYYIINNIKSYHIHDYNSIIIMMSR